MDETPKKIVGNNCFLCSIGLIPSARVRVFGKSSVDIPGLIENALETDISVFSSSDPFICSKCYKRLNRFGKIETDLRSIQNEIKEDYKKSVVRTKRLRRDSDETDVNTASRGHLTVQQPTGTAAKSLKFVNISTTSTSSDITEKQDNLRTLLISEGHGGHTKSIPVNEQDVPQTPSKEGLFFSPPPPSLHLTSTPIGGDLLPKTRTEPGVKITIQYQSKPVNRLLPSEYEAIGKALVYGPPQRIAKAVVKCKQLTTHVLQSVLRLVSSEVCDLCSRSNPSLLRKCGKEDLIKFDFQSLCEEWKHRAPIFYSFLMTCSSVRLSRDEKWFPSVAIAGSVLLKQRNAQMNATASVLGTLIKTRSIEV